MNMYESTLSMSLKGSARIRFVRLKEGLNGCVTPVLSKSFLMSMNLRGLFAASSD